MAWEGSPGFEMGKPWNPGHLLPRRPLKALLARRRLKEVRAWRRRGMSGAAAVARATSRPSGRSSSSGETALGRPPTGSSGHGGPVVPPAAADPEGTAPTSPPGRAPAPPSSSMGEGARRPVDARKAPKLAALAGPGHPGNVAWRKALELVKGGGAGLAALEGAFPKELAALPEGSAADAPLLPARWLLAEWGL